MMRSIRLAIPATVLSLCAPMPCAHAQCPADVTGDGTVGTADLVDVMLAWGPCAAQCPADLDASGTVDTEDLVQVLIGWGPCPNDGPCVSETILHIEASSALGSATMSFPLEEGVWLSDSVYIWCLSSGCETVFPPDDPHELVDPNTGATIGTVLFARVKVVFGSRLDVEAKVVSGDAPTSFVFSTATVSMDTIDASIAEGRSLASAAISDMNCDGWAEVFGLGPDEGVLRATYNGGDDLFAELLGGAAVEGSCWPFLGYGSAADPQSGYRAVGDSVSDIAAELAFEVTSGDWAQVTGKFWILPEPGACQD